MEESVACQPQTSSSWTSNSALYTAQGCPFKFIKAEIFKLSLYFDIVVKGKVSTVYVIFTLHTDEIKESPY